MSFGIVFELGEVSFGMLGELSNNFVLFNFSEILFEHNCGFQNTVIYERDRQEHKIPHVLSTYIRFFPFPPQKLSKTCVVSYVVS